MKTNSSHLIRIAAYWAAFTFLAGSSFLSAQDSNTAPPQSAPPAQDQNSTAGGGWRRMGSAPPADGNTDVTVPNQDPNQAPAPNYPPPAAAVPPRLTLPAGTFVTARINQPLSSDHNQAGDAFSASLVQPIVVDGVIVAQRGQTIGGRVTEAQKAARSGDSPSRLGIQLTDLTLVDGQVVPIQSQLISMTGPSAAGRNTGAILGTTALGAAIGAAAGWGTGAAIGAGAGAAAGTIGVLVARGRPTVIAPESVLTFRVEAPVTIATDRAPQAFRYVNTTDYNRTPAMQPRMAPGAGPGYGYAPPPPAYYGYGYGYPYYPYYYGPGFGLYYGPGFYYGGRVFIGRGFYRGGFRR